ncbi:hypothetical protein SETIT_1G351500v2 [Setaria italica]|uniref:Uncharacterized protein n=1 Tax=Setaria italica TaxID=4555 RepID=A0A368PSX6_SETIT|nr:hypothetical protein SETIT_1G351500v2 [Setaria italica]RCV08743.1 hypothetical protein SETIT_1G351500v2 [Setaria italica]
MGATARPRADPIAGHLSQFLRLRRVSSQVLSPVSHCILSSPFPSFPSPVSFLPRSRSVEGDPASGGELRALHPRERLPGEHLDAGGRRCSSAAGQVSTAMRGGRWLSPAGARGPGEAG